MSDEGQNPPGNSSIGGFISNLFRKVTFKSTRPTSVMSERSTSPMMSEDGGGDYYDQRASELNLPNSSTYFTRNPSLDSEYLRRADSTMSVRSRSNTGGGGSGITSRDFWMSDEKVKECYDCKALFTAFRRRHHCRICGQIFCHKCASNIISGAKWGYLDDLRVCDFCLRVMNQQTKYDDSMDINPIAVKSPNMNTNPPFSADGIHKKTPFRHMMDDDLDTAYIDEISNTAIKDEEYSTKSPRTFVKLSPERADSLESDFRFAKSNPLTSGQHDRMRSPSLTTRRKFANRYFNRFIHTPSSSIAQIQPSESQLQQPIEGNFEMNAASKQHMKLLMHQMLEKSETKFSEEWKVVIFQMLLQVCNKLNPNVRQGDEIDIRNYVKIKRIPGGLVSESMYINGVVASKTVIHKQMLKPISNPRILLLTFPIEYQRIQNEFVSFDTLLAQERDHLRILVGRLIALKPDIVLVEKTVARIALEMLLQADICILSNVKISVLSAVSRCTQAEIIHSIDKLSMEAIGSCSQVTFRTYIHPYIDGHRKTFLFVEGVPEYLGCTLVIRGGPEAELARIKEIIDFLVFAMYNLKLETSLYQDEFAMTPELEPNVDTESTPNVAVDLYKRAIHLYETTILSASPNIRFPSPYLLMHQDATTLSHNEPNDAEMNLVMDLAESHIPFLVNADRLSPLGHQNIVVLYSNSSPSTIIPCSPPRPHLIEYYRDSDLTIGQFIEDSCMGSNLACMAKGCEKLELLHYRTYSHGSGKIIVTVNPLPCPVKGMEDRIVIWSLCRKCSQSTPFIPMSEETWKYSFGKYLELTFYHSKLLSRSHSCTHDLHRDHFRYFSFQNLAVRFEYENITLFEISGPPMHRKPKPELLMKLRQDDADLIQLQIKEYYDSIMDRTQMFTYEIVAPLKLVSCREMLSSFQKKAIMEKKVLIQLLHETLISCEPTDCLGLNEIYKQFYEKIGEWEQEFSLFIKNFLTSDVKEIRRVTAAQIKRIFAEKEPPSLLEKHVFQAGEGESEFVHIEKVKLPSLDYSENEFDLEYEFPSNLNRKMSIELMKTDNDCLPIVGTSPIIPKHVISSSSPTLLESDNILATTSSSKHDSIQISDLKSDAHSASIAGSVEVSLSSSASIPRSRPKTIRFDSSVRSSSPINHGIFSNDKEEESPELNIISGVAGEKENVHFDPGVGSEPARPTSLMKTITNIWNGNPGNFLPLKYPSSNWNSDHIFAESSIIVREDEPSSIISFALSSSQYLLKLQVMREGSAGGQNVHLSEKDHTNQRISVDFDDSNQADIEDTQRRETGSHIRYQFWDGSTKFLCKIYFAEQFDALRRNCNIDGTFEESLARCIKWDATGGRSGTFFMKTRDDWLVVKKLSQIELDALISFSPAYFEYMSQAIFHELPTVLAKIFGFYHISFKNPVTRKSVKMDILVMENLFYDRQNISSIFDLKGSVRNRHIQSTGKQNEVLLDKNLLEMIFDNPLFIREHSKKLLRSSVYNDTLFLSKLNVMDYSLLVGIDNESKELVIGIVDFIRTFTWDKKLESWVKETGLLGGGKEPTIVTPRQYKNRFREAMERYFLMVPDKFVIAGNIARDEE